MKKLVSMLLVFCLIATVAFGTFAISASSAPITQSAISPEDFKTPPMESRPGVRWWWSMGSTAEDLVKQVEYLAENNFGVVEIAPFNGFYVNDIATVSPQGQNMSYLTKYPDPELNTYDTPAYYSKLDKVIKKCNELGIVVDLNMGSGYEANDPDITPEESMGNMALGRTTRIIAEGDDDTRLITVPTVEISPLYNSRITGGKMADWTGVKRLEGVLFGYVKADGTALTAGNKFIDLDSQTVAKTYLNQLVLDPQKSFVVDASEIVNGKVSFTPPYAGKWEIIAIYSVPSGSYPIRGMNNSMVVDHMNAADTASFVEKWAGDINGLKPLLAKYDVRAGFNDSYEFYTDKYFNDKLYEAAKAPNNIIGYDLTKYFPTMYRLRQNAFTIGLDSSYGITPYAATTTDFFKYDIPADEATRITYDQNQLINELFMGGMESFSTNLKKYGMVYRQQAYNPPIDTLKAAKYVDIPETEGTSEYSLRRIASGAHLYGKNDVTCEVFTLGNVPYTVTPQTMRAGYDTLATSGVTNFFYHGLSSIYFGSAAAKADQAYGEEGWRAWNTIGIEVGAVNPISGYFKQLNAYAARNNFVMSEGKPSTDVAVYMPLFGSMNSTNVYNSLNKFGYTYDAINDDCIQNELDFVNGQFVVAASGLKFDTLALQTTAASNLPKETIVALKALAAKGAPIVFYGALPERQASYANGNYAQLDQYVKENTAALVNDNASVVQVADAAAFESFIASKVSAPISMESNTNIRIARRVLETGGEVALIKNTSATANTDVTIKVASGLKNCYWLDQNTGKIHKAEVKDGKVALSLKANTSIMLLGEPDGVAMGSSAVSAGIPDSINSEKLNSVALDGFSLSVTADNIGSFTTGAVTTKTYTGSNVFGNWKDASFNGGALQYVSDEGVYSTTLNINDISQYAGKKVLINLGTCYSPVTVVVNGEEIGQVTFNPFSIDISRALKQGANVIELKMQPIGYNRRAGLSKAWSTTGEQKYWHYYQYVYSTGSNGNYTLRDTGIAGPITLDMYESTEAISRIDATTAQVAPADGKETSFKLSLKDVKDVYTVEASFTYNPAISKYVGYEMLDSKYMMIRETKNETLGKIDLIIGVKGGVGLTVSELTSIVKLKFDRLVDIHGTVMEFKATSVKVGSVDDSDVTVEIPLAVAPDTAKITIADTAKAADINKDGVVSIADLSLAMKYYGALSTDSNWETAKKCDIDGNGAVDMADLILILTNYTV